MAFQSQANNRESSNVEARRWFSVLVVHYRVLLLIQLCNQIRHMFV